MDDILQDFAERKSTTVMGRVRDAILERNKLQDLKGNFGRSTETFKDMLSLLDMEAHDIHPNDVVSQQKLGALLHRQSKEAMERQNEAKENAKSRQRVEKVLEILEERQVARPGTVTVQNQNQVLIQLEAGAQEAWSIERKGKGRPTQCQSGSFGAAGSCYG